MPGSALADIEHLEALDEHNKLGMLFYRLQETAKDSQSGALKAVSQRRTHPSIRRYADARKPRLTRDW